MPPSHAAMAKRVTGQIALACNNNVLQLKQQPFLQEITAIQCSDSNGDDGINVNVKACELGGY